MSLAAIVAWAMLAVLIGWLGMVLWATFRQLDGEVAASRDERGALSEALGGVRRPGANVRLALRRRSGCSASVRSAPAARRRRRRRASPTRAPGGCSRAAPARPAAAASSAPRYSTSSAASPRTVASGPSTARMISARVISSGLAREPVAAVGAAPAVDQPVRPAARRGCSRGSASGSPARRRAPRPSPARAPRLPRPRARPSPARHSRLWRRRAWTHLCRMGSERACAVEVKSGGCVPSACLANICSPMRKKEAERAAAIRLRLDGWSLRRIANELDVSIASVSTWVRHVRTRPEARQARPPLPRAIRRRGSSNATVWSLSANPSDRGVQPTSHAWSPALVPTVLQGVLRRKRRSSPGPVCTCQEAPRAGRKGVHRRVPLDPRLRRLRSARPPRSRVRPSRHQGRRREQVGRTRLVYLSTRDGDRPVRGCMRQLPSPPHLLPGERRNSEACSGHVAARDLR